MRLRKPAQTVPACERYRPREYPAASIGAEFAPRLPDKFHKYESRHQYPFPRHPSGDGRLLFRLRRLCLRRGQRSVAADGWAGGLLPRGDLRRALLHRRDDHPPDHRHLHARCEIPLSRAGLSDGFRDGRLRHSDRHFRLAGRPGDGACRLRPRPDRDLRRDGRHRLYPVQSDPRELGRSALRGQSAGIHLGTGGAAGLHRRRHGPDRLGLVHPAPRARQTPGAPRSPAA